MIYLILTLVYVFIANKFIDLTLYDYVSLPLKFTIHTIAMLWPLILISVLIIEVYKWNGTKTSH